MINDFIYFIKSIRNIKKNNIIKYGTVHKKKKQKKEKER